MPYPSRSARIDLRVNPAQKALLEQAAAAQGRNLSDFVISASTEAAQLALADQNRFALPEAQMQRFLDALDAPVHPVDGLRELFARRNLFEDPADQK